MPLQSLTLWAARNGQLAMNKVAESVEVMMINFAFLCAFARNGLLAKNKVAEPELWGRDLSRP